MNRSGDAVLNRAVASFGVLLLSILVVAALIGDNSRSAVAAQNIPPSPSAYPDALATAPAFDDQTVIISEVILGPGEGYRKHLHFGISSLVVTSGAVCYAQETSGAGTIFVVRAPGSNWNWARCEEVDFVCNSVATDESEQCSFKICNGGCTLSAGDSVLLNAGDAVVQTDSNHHYYVAKSSGATLINNSVQSPGEGGCIGDCV